MRQSLSPKGTEAILKPNSKGENKKENTDKINQIKIICLLKDAIKRVKNKYKPSSGRVYLPCTKLTKN